VSTKTEYNHRQKFSFGTGEGQEEESQWKN